ncbi:unnamed protein product [Oppiella nova]|uniref:NR LBD domain-containing protein n=1 Tax=Oppiella nova TaxID=334625 RepID=A0A7R9LR96_9ACAR|nr:unnamed protein product [Oppiella nova]CAG2166117.1 unnamed protein product [Oppiella nova]
MCNTKCLVCGDTARANLKFKGNLSPFASSNNNECMVTITTYDYRIANHNTFNESEANKLGELLNANKCFSERLIPMTVQAVTFRDVNQLLENRPNLLDRHIRRQIKMCKNLAEFNSICETDRISLIKSSCLELFLLRSLTKYNINEHFWSFHVHYYPSSSWRPDMFKSASYDSLLRQADGTSLTRHCSPVPATGFVRALNRYDITGTFEFNIDRMVVIHVRVLQDVLQLAVMTHVSDNHFSAYYCNENID